MDWYYIVLIVFLVIAFTFLSSTYFKGWYGEYIFYLLIKRIVKDDGKIIRDIIIPKIDDNNVTSQIDNVIISRKGIFVIEIKNFSGKIYGSDEQKEWTQSLNYGKNNYKFYSPVKQNKTHVNRIKEHIKLEIDIFSVIIFIKADISSLKSNYTYDIKRFKKFYRNQKIKYSNSEIEHIYNYFLHFKKNKVKTTKEHVKGIIDKQKMIEKNICPYCNKKLVLRTGKYGGFYACDNYPKCKFTKSID